MVHGSFQLLCVRADYLYQKIIQVIYLSSKGADIDINLTLNLVISPYPQHSLFYTYILCTLTRIRSWA